MPDEHRGRPDEAEAPDSRPATPAAGPEPEISQLMQRVLWVITSPVQLGERLRPPAPWFWTLAIPLLVTAAIVLLLPEEVIRKVAEAQMQGREGVELPPPLVMRGFLAGGGLLFGAAVAAVIAGILYLVAAVGFGQGEITYRQHLSAVAHIFWIGLIGGLVAFPIQIARGELEVKLGLGLLLPEEPSSFFEHFLSNITIFGLWMSAALGGVESGLSRGRVSVGTAAGTVIALYLIWGAITAGFRGFMG